MTEDNSQKLALSESFERVAKVAKEREAFNEAMEHVIHSSMPIDFERRYAMDNLIAQDADLIDTNDKDSAVLLPCPFCGGVQIEAFHHIDRGWGASWHVECVAEECGNSTCHHDTEATAIAAWNKRQPTQSDALREAVIEECAKALEADAKKCDCAALEANECACGAWDDYKSVTSDRAVEIVRALKELG